MRASPRSGNRLETDWVDSGAQLGSVSNSWLVILLWRTTIFFQVKESGPGPLEFNIFVFF